MKQWRWLLLTLLIVFLDQWMKHWALSTLTPYHPFKVMPMFNLTLAFNTGAAFSFLHHTGPWHYWFFLIFSTGMSIVFCVWLFSLPASSIRLSLALSCILAGALGNLWDRLCLGYVVDFIELYIGRYYWPVFNIADVAICFGGSLLAIEWFLRKEEGKG